MIRYEGNMGVDATRLNINNINAAKKSSRDTKWPNSNAGEYFYGLF